MLAITVERKYELADNYAIQSLILVNKIIDISGLVFQEWRIPLNAIIGCIRLVKDGCCDDYNEEE
jgi:hypothetical protein